MSTAKDLITELKKLTGIGETDNTEIDLTFDEIKSRKDNYTINYETLETYANRMSNSSDFAGVTMVDGLKKELDTLIADKKKEVTAAETAANAADDAGATQEEKERLKAELVKLQNALNLYIINFMQGIQTEHANFKLLDDRVDKKKVLTDLIEKHGTKIENIRESIKLATANLLIYKTSFPDQNIDLQNNSIKEIETKLGKLEKN